MNSLYRTQEERGAAGSARQHLANVARLLGGLVAARVRTGAHVRKASRDHAQSLGDPRATSMPKRGDLPLREVGVLRLFRPLAGRPWSRRWARNSVLESILRILTSSHVRTILL